MTRRATYYVAGRSGGSGGNEAIAALWNPSGTVSIEVVYIDVLLNGSGSNPELTRTSARGTPGSTVTPDIDNHANHRLAPGSGALLDLGNYTVDVTRTGPDLAAWKSSGVAGGGFAWRAVGGGIIVDAGTGLAVWTVDLLSTGWDVTFGWRE